MVENVLETSAPPWSRHVCCSAFLRLQEIDRPENRSHNVSQQVFKRNNRFVFLAALSATFVGWSLAAKAADLSIVSVQPTPRNTSAPINQPISVTFDNPVKRETIVSLRSFWAFGRWSGTAEGVYTFSDGDRTVTLHPDHAFSAGEQIMVVLSNDVEATNGTRLRGAGYSFQYWTRANPASMDFQLIDTMTTRTTPAQSSRAYGGIATDLNGDRFLDITIVNEDTADLRVFMNRADGSGLFHPFIQPTFPIGEQASPSEPSDFNRDGIADICVANINDQSISVLLGHGDGTFASQQRVVVGVAPRGIAVLDADGDGDIDIVNTNNGSNNMSLLLNDGTGIFDPPTFFDAGGGVEWALAAADMNGDGVLDLIVGTQSNVLANRQVLIDLGNGDGTFSFHSAQVSDGNVWVLNTGDLDGDGDEDVALANSSANHGTILLNDGAAGLGAPRSYGTDPFTLSTDLGDLDGDGDLDWVTSSFSGDWRVFSNDGDGTFTFDREFTAPTASSCALLLDIDNDNDLDLALIDELADEVVLMKNSGTASVPAVSTWGITSLVLLLLTTGTIVLQSRRQLIPGRT